LYLKVSNISSRYKYHYSRDTCIHFRDTCDIDPKFDLRVTWTECLNNIVILAIWKKTSKIEDSKEGIDEEDEVYSFRITNVYDLDFILKLIYNSWYKSIYYVRFVC